MTVPMTLSTVSGPGQGTSYRQCVLPGYFDYDTNRMQFNFCWQYKCLPDAFSQGGFMATMADLSRLHLADMPGGVVYNATISAPVGVKVDVTGKAKAANRGNIVFNNYPTTATPPPQGGGVVSQNVTIPQGGVSNFTFVYSIPTGYDDLSVNVSMQLYPDQPVPARPPPPDAQLCPCPAEPDAGSGACPEDTGPATITRTDGVIASTRQRPSSMCFCSSSPSPPAGAGHASPSTSAGRPIPRQSSRTGEQLDKRWRST
jgi:hypothetical protein